MCKHLKRSAILSTGKHGNGDNKKDESKGDNKKDKSEGDNKKDVSEGDNKKDENQGDNKKNENQGFQGMYFIYFLSLIDGFIGIHCQTFYIKQN